jgi:beta-glucoside operon transcriptional antiterminator
MRAFFKAFHLCFAFFICQKGVRKLKIRKVLNNNAVVAADKDDREIVAMGKGIAFQKRPGALVPEEKAEKVFYLEDKKTFSRFQDLICSIPMAHLLLSERIINYGKTSLGKKLHEIIYVTLPDHISSAIERYQEGLKLKNPMYWDIRRFYPEEFEVGQKAVEIVKEETGVEFLPDEAAFIAVHFVNAELNDDMSRMYHLTQIMEDSYTLVKNYFHTEFDENSLDCYRFLTHLKFFAQRVVDNTHYHDDDDEDLLEVVCMKHPKAYDCARHIQRMIQEKYHSAVTEEEVLYLTIHIARVTRRQNLKPALQEKEPDGPDKEK